MKLSKGTRALLERIVAAGGRLMTQQLCDDNYALAKRLANAGYIKAGKHPTVLTGDRTEGVETLVATDEGRAALAKAEPTS